MIKRYRFGNPICTYAVVEDIPFEKDRIAGWNVDADKKNMVCTMESDTVVYGLGETVRGINKRGFVYRSFCSDDPNHDEDKSSLYGAQNFFIIDSVNKSTGYFVDTPGIVNFDIGFTKLDTFCITFEDFDADIYVVEGIDNRDIVTQFRKLIGKSYVPPKWAFGYGQSRWGYKDAQDIEWVINGYKNAGIPLDMVYMDIDYMVDYKDFTVDPEKFPEFENFVSEKKAEGIHLVPIIDAGVKIQEGYDVCEEGLKNGYFCKMENGEELVAAVWPGTSYLPDFLNSKTREWFGNKYKILLDKGIEGFWNDMNEPAIFYTDIHLKEAFEKLDEFKGKNLDIDSYFEFTGLVGSISNSMEDYQRFYHDYDGQRFRHDKVHNLYGYNMTKAAGEAFERLSPDKRILMFSRSSYIGMHRYGGIWTGDNKSWWSHLLLNIQQLPALNMCGFLYSGADTGGFGSNTTEDLMKRWLAVSVFTPLFRNHAAKGTRQQELFVFGDNETFKNLISVRYALLPYIYSEYMKAVRDSKMLFEPLAFEYKNDARAREVEDQLLFGESLMIAPVYKQNATGRYVYLPEDMKLVKFKSATEYTEEILEKGDHYINVALDEIPVFIRPGHVLPVAGFAENVSKVNYDDLKYLTYKVNDAKYELYNDDGISR